MARFLRRKQVAQGPPGDGVWQVPERFNFTRDVVETLAADPLRPALTFVDQDGVIDRRTFSDVATDANRWAALLRRRGLVAGERVVVAVDKTPVWHGVLLGALKAGIVAVPCSESISADELARRVAITNARLVVASSRIASALVSAGPPVDIVGADEASDELRLISSVQATLDTLASDPAFILFSAGTTGPAKGAALTHASTWAARVQAEHWLDARPGDLVWCTGDAGSALMIWNTLLGPWSRGAEAVIHDGPFDVEQRFDLLRRLGVTILCQSVEESVALVEGATHAHHDLGRVRHAVVTGDALDPELLVAFEERFGLALYEGYGQTESSIIVSNTRNAPVKPGSMGLPMPGHQVVVLNIEGDEQFEGVAGEIALGGTPPSLFTGYWSDPDATDAALRDGWYRTGDRARRDADGYLWFVGRKEAVDLHDPIGAEEPAVTTASPSVDAAAALADPILEEASRRKRERVAEREELAADEAAARTERRADLERRTAEALGAEEVRRAQAQVEAEAADQARREERERAAELERHEAEAAERRRLEAEANLRQQQEQAARLEAAEAAEAAQIEAERVRAQEPAAAPEPASSGRAARREAERRRKEEERAQKEAEKRRQEEEKAAAEQRKREEAEEQHAAAERGREAERRRKEEDRIRREEEKAAAEQAKRDAEERQRAARADAELQRQEENRQRAEEEERKKQVEKERKAEEKRQQEEERKRRPASPRTTIPDPDDEHLADERPNAELIARLRAYGRREPEDTTTTTPPPERDDTPPPEQ